MKPIEVKVFGRSVPASIQNIQLLPGKKQHLVTFELSGESYHKVVALGNEHGTLLQHPCNYSFSCVVASEKLRAANLL